MGLHDTEQQHDSAGGGRQDVVVAHLVLVKPGPLRAFPLTSAAGVTLGREGGDACDLQFADPRMSRIHARVEYRLAEWALIDQGSRNGAFVDGMPVASGGRAPLADGSVIRLGDTILLLRATSPTHDEELPAFPGRSAAAAAVRVRLRRLVASGGHVLILGETGTGKERVARALAKSDAPFVVQNCAELTRELIRAELFGYLRGAFTGAQCNRDGLVDAAAGGALFLDEIGDLPLDVQADLLRFLEDGSFRPVGSLSSKFSDARVIAATNVDLDAAVGAGKFRRDLLARLRASNAPLELPALRDRCEDVPRWTRAFGLEAGAEPPEEMWTAGALECLLLYGWPDNLRELRGLVRRLVEEEPRWPIGAEALPEALRERRVGLRTSPREPSGPIPPIPARPAVDPTKEVIEVALREAKGNMKVVAERLELDRRKLYRLCERLGIPFEDYR
ncbi:MAG: sigma 54-interacting transcriptional regulator [Kofleriaceae bacterium]